MAEPPALFYALNRIAQLLAIETLTSANYTDGRDRLIRRERRRDPLSEIVDLLPTGGQI